MGGRKVGVWGGRAGGGACFGYPAGWNGWIGLADWVLPAGTAERATGFNTQRSLGAAAEISAPRNAQQPKRVVIASPQPLPSRAACAPHRRRPPGRRGTDREGAASSYRASDPPHKSEAGRSIPD